MVERRLTNPNAPIREIYEQVTDDWERSRNLFQQNGAAMPPIVGTFRVPGGTQTAERDPLLALLPSATEFSGRRPSQREPTLRNPYQIYQSFEFYPQRPSEDVVRRLAATAVEVNDSGFVPEQGCLLFDLGAFSPHSDNFSVAIAHESAHAAMPITPYKVQMVPNNYMARLLKKDQLSFAGMTIIRDDRPPSKREVISHGAQERFLDILGSMNGYIPGFGTALKAMATSNISAKFEHDMVGPGEFFAALAQAHLLGCDYRFRAARWEDAIATLKEIIYPAVKLSDTNLALLGKAFTAAEQGSEQLKDLILHFPQVAGDAFVESYDYDVEEALREHPEILTLDGEDLWTQVCVPLLTSGKLP